MNFITGATGLVGMRIVFDLLSDNQQVVALKRSTSNLELVRKVFAYYGNENLFEKITWREGDVTDVFSLEEAMQGCTQVYHTAALVSFHRKDKKAMYQTNVLGTANVVNVALELGMKKICYISSTAAIGRSASGQTVNEKNEWKESPLNTSYAESKYNAELEVWRGVEEGLDAIIVNPSVIIGPGTRDRSSAMLFGKKIPFYPQGINGYVAVEDVSSICLKLMAKNMVNQRFILSSENVDYKNLFTCIARSMNYQPPKLPAKKWMIKAGWIAEGIQEFFTGKKAQITRETIRNAGNEVYYDSSKIQNQLSFEFYPVEKSILETGKYYLNFLKS